MKQDSFPTEYHLINEILMSWNPLGVDTSILDDEYISLIPRIIKLSKDRSSLSLYLREALEQLYGVEYSVNELYAVVESIYQIK